MTDNLEKRCGFVGLIGAPNAGKSTLMNCLVGSKVSIVSPKVQTTRSRVLGITIHDQSQIIFVDTPGIFTPQKRMEKAMVAAAWQGARDADVIAVLIDASRSKISDESWGIIKRLETEERKAILILNKIDLIKRDTLLALADELNKSGVFTDIYMVSALKGDGIKKLMDDLSKTMPEGPWHYAEDQISDMPMRLLAAEITREKIFLQLQQELPYETTVETEEWEVFDNGDIKIRQIIYVMRKSQKAIVLGKKGVRIKSIGEKSRKELEELFDTRVHLNLFVKVRENWIDDPERYRDWGLDFNA